MQKKSVTGRFWSLRVGLQDWYVTSRLQVRPKSPSSKTALDFMGPYYLLTEQKNVAERSYNYLKKFFFWKQKKKQGKKIKKKKNVPVAPKTLELGAHTGRSFDISNEVVSCSKRVAGWHN